MRWAGVPRRPTGRRCDFFGVRWHFWDEEHLVAFGAGHSRDTHTDARAHRWANDVDEIVPLGMRRNAVCILPLDIQRKDVILRERDAKHRCDARCDGSPAWSAAGLMKGIETSRSVRQRGRWTAGRGEARVPGPDRC